MPSCPTDAGTQALATFRDVGDPYLKRVTEMLLGQADRRVGQRLGKLSVGYGLSHRIAAFSEGSRGHAVSTVGS